MEIDHWCYVDVSGLVTTVVEMNEETSFVYSNPLMKAGRGDDTEDPKQSQHGAPNSPLFQVCECKLRKVFH